jgi:hypothetical protein
VCVCVCMCVCVCARVLLLDLFQDDLRYFILTHVRSIVVVSRSLSRKSVFSSPTRLKNLLGDTEVAGTARYCLAIRAKLGCY